MSAVRMDGKMVSAKVRGSILEEVNGLKEKGVRPGLAVIIVGEDPASKVYVRNKERACEECGFYSEKYALPEETTQEELLGLIDELNHNPHIDGILCQLPVPKHINEDRVIEAISAEKDVDGFHPHNVAALWQKRPCVAPCTPKGIMKMLDEHNVEIEGKNAVVIGRSNIVGLPMAKMLLDRNATVTMAHSRTRNLPQIAAQADILVVAVGRPRFAGADFVKPGATVIDVGINRDPETGKLVGDVDFDAVKDAALLITPVPGGVGPMTRACLMENTLECYLNRVNK